MKEVTIIALIKANRAKPPKFTNPLSRSSNTIDLVLPPISENVSPLNSYGQSSKYTSSTSGDETNHNRQPSNYSSNKNYPYNVLSNRVIFANRTNNKSNHSNDFPKTDSVQNLNEDYDDVTFEFIQSPRVNGNAKENMKTNNQQQERKTIDPSKSIEKLKQKFDQQHQQRSLSLQSRVSYMAEFKQKSNQQYASNLKAKNSFLISNTKKTNGGSLRPSTCANLQQNPEQLQSQTQMKGVYMQQTNTQLNSKKGDQIKLIIGEFNKANLETLETENDEVLHKQIVKNRINKWIDEVKRCSQNLPPSPLSWFDDNIITNEDTNSNDSFHNNKEDDFELSDYDSCDYQIFEYHRVVDRTFCVVHND